MNKRRTSHYKVRLAGISNHKNIGAYQGFQRDGTMQLFGRKGQKFLHCPGTKGQWDNLKILPRDGTGRDSQNLGRDGPGQPKSGTGRGTKRDRAEKDVLKQYKDVLKQKRMF